MNSICISKSKRNVYAWNIKFKCLCVCMGMKIKLHILQRVLIRMTVRFHSVSRTSSTLAVHRQSGEKAFWNFLVILFETGELRIDFVNGIITLFDSWFFSLRRPTSRHSINYMTFWLKCRLSASDSLGRFLIPTSFLDRSNWCLFFCSQSHCHFYSDLMVKGKIYKPIFTHWK